MAFQRISVSGLLILFGVLVNAISVNTYNVEIVPDSLGHLGEGPHWDIETQNLYSVDLKYGILRRFDYREKKMYTCQIENEVFASFVIPIEKFADRFAVGIEHHVASVKWDGVSETCKVDTIIATVEESDSKYENNRFNDAKCDPRGRLFAGTMQKSDYALRTGNLYKIPKRNESERIVCDLGISNGLAWNANAKKFYLIDSEDKTLKSFDYDINTGEIENPKVIYKMSKTKTEALPDGMTIDYLGFLYVAINGGSAVYKIDPNNGQVLQKIKIPVRTKQITSVAFGGPNLDILYVTTADEKSTSGKTNTFAVTGLGTRGLPMQKMKL